MYSIQQMKVGSPCMQGFMKQATTHQIQNVSMRVGEQYAYHGFFTWILNKGPRDSYWWAGYGGQRVGVDPVKERIIVVTSSRESYMGTISKVFNAWQEM
jgi:CubicO group peptidase (beta-lactamase class C family)